MPRVTHQGGSVQYEDTVGVDGDSGVSILGFRNDADALMATADLSHTRLSADASGRLKLASIAGDVEVVQPTHDDLNANANLQVGDADVAAANPVPVVDVWTVALVSDEAVDDSDKTLTVTAAQLWHLLWIWVELTTTATVGNRQIVIELQDTANDVIFQVRAGVTQAASLTYYYCFAPSMADLTAVRDTDYLMTPLPPTVLLPAAFQIRVYDNNAVAVAADDLIIQAQYAWKAV